jgi:IPT/TIG domain-containing protein
MKTACLLLLTLLASGCGYSSKGSGMMAPGAPDISQLVPNSMTKGGQAFTLNVMGTNFASGATVFWNGGARTTTFVSSSQVTASISAADIATAQTVLVHVTNPGGSYMNQGGQSSPSVDFTVTP